MNDNLFFGLIAISKEMRLFLISLIHNNILIGFVAGVFITVLVTGFVLTKNPRHIPLILRYSSAESFSRIASRDKNGTYTMAYSNFIKVHTQIRVLFLIAVISFFVMVTTALIIKP